MKLPVINNTTYNCFQYLIVTVAKYYNCDYRLMMLELWGFSYDSTVDSTIGDRLRLCWSGNINERKRLLWYHGLGFNINHTTEANKFIYLNSKEGPIAVFADSFECSWVPFYQKMHRSHAFFVFECDEDGYYVWDQYCQGKIISKDFIENNTTSIITFFQCQADKFNIINEMKERINKWAQSGFEQYRMFIDDMKNNFILEEEINEDPTESKLVMHLKNISEDRLNFLETICLFEEYFLLDLNDVKVLLHDISVGYQKFRAYIIKFAFLHKTPTKKIITEELNRIYTLEHRVYDRVKEVIEEKRGD